MDIPHGSPSGGATPVGSKLRPGTSPSRHHHGLSALSPLQGLSPMPSAAKSLYPEQRDRPETLSRSQSHRHRRTPSAGGDSDSASLGGHSRAGSITRSLSRRQSVYRSAAEWGEGKEYLDENLTNPAALFSRLTIVRAPSENKEKEGPRKRSKSTTALASTLTGVTPPVDIPATSARAPRRSFASSFNTLTPLASNTASGRSTPSAANMNANAKPSPVGYSPGGPDAVHRISTIYSAENDGGRTRSYTPAEVVEIARGLASPVLVPEGGFKGAELKRRKSSGASYNRSGGASALGSSLGSETDASPEKPPTALEPVEYVQLDDDMLLPFVNRMEEVDELLKHPSNEKLFTLLRSAFPKDGARKNWQELSPEEWSWDEFVQHLTATDRIECPDYAWIFRARQAVRKRSVALWEKVGVCLGCDDMLLNAGEEGVRATWKGLGGAGDDEDDEPGMGFMSHVWIEGLQPVDPDELARAEQDFRGAFGEPVEESEEANAGMTALLGTIGEGEGEESGGSSGGGMTTAQKAGARAQAQRDPLVSPHNNTSALPDSPTSMTDPNSPLQRQPSNSARRTPSSTSTRGRALSGSKASRSKSFVGLTIISPSSTSGPTQFAFSPVHTPGLYPGSLPHTLGAEGEGGAAGVITMDRGPGEALFPSSFSSLSVEPNLGRGASGAMGAGQAKATRHGMRSASTPLGPGGVVLDPHHPMVSQGQGGQGGAAAGGLGIAMGMGAGQRVMRRKQSGTGLSESAITFASESEYAHSGDVHD